MGSALVLLGTALGCGKSIRDDDTGAGRAGMAGGSGHAGTAGKSGKSGTAGTGAEGGTSGSGGRSGAGSGGTTATAGTTSSGGESGEAGVPSSAGASATGGSAGSGSGYLSQIRQSGVSKFDLLFMVDNSLSMASKQTLLAASIPGLIEQLITPACVDGSGMPTGASADASGNCSQGAPKFVPVRDLHVGIITSSLGDHGSNDVCSDAQNSANIAANLPASNYNDLAQLLPSVRPGANLPNWNNSSFLVWDPRDQSAVSDPHPNLGPNETDSAHFIAAFSTEVLGAGQLGCGYESSLEAWYRFLVDPSPVASMSNDGQNSVRPKTPDGKSDAVNNVVLQQRASFLRPDSLLAIVVLTDENDCSIMDEDGSQSWLVGYKGGVGKFSWDMPRANSVCATNPNDTCCRPCTSPAPQGCADNSADSACALGNYLTLDEDSMNQRCYNMKQRFGVDLLYPTGRYVDALKSSLITPRLDGVQVPNPIFAAPKGQLPRDPGLVFFAAITGVPWQDISTTDSWSGRGLTYMTAQQLMDNGRWGVLLGDPTSHTPPTDPFMLEQIDPRVTGAQNPLLPSITIQPPLTTTPNAINGHEQQPAPVRDDLQFACTFPLASPVPCNADNADSCDCNADEFSKNSPLCSGGSATTDGTQVNDGAYPGLRELEVLKDFGINSVIGSICPKNVDAPGGGAPSNSAAGNPDPDYGYNPFIRALVSRITEDLTLKCLPRALPIASDGSGQAACTIVETTFPTDGTCDCAAMARSGVADQLRTSILNYLRINGICDGSTAQSCSDACTCTLPQLSGADLAQCQSGNDGSSGPGYCYIDPAQGLGSDAAVVDCQSTQKHLIRFVGDNVPVEGSTTFISCE